LDNVLKLSVEKILRAYIPSQEVAKWFNGFLNDKYEIDMWLTPRLTKNNLMAGNFSNTSFVIYKYYAEFKVSNFKSWTSTQRTMENRGVKLLVLVDDVEKYLRGIQLKKIKRDINETKTKNRYLSLRSKVIGKYASYNDIIQWMVCYAFFTEISFNFEI
jgi:hypothetical protein